MLSIRNYSSTVIKVSQMFISPKHAIEQGWIILPEHIKQNLETYIQPNAIDFDISSVHEPVHTLDNFTLHADNSKQMKEWVGQKPQDGMFAIPPQDYVDVASSIHVNLPNGVAALLIVRSTLNRNGLFLTSGLYDSGYQGAVGAILHNQAPTYAYIEQGARIGQLILVSSDAAEQLYGGQYNTSDGQHWTEKQQ